MKPSFDTWIFHYFEYLLEMYDIYVSNMPLEINRSWGGFRKFAKNIYDTSSGIISPFLDTHTFKIEKLYLEFLNSTNG